MRTLDATAVFGSRASTANFGNGEQSRGQIAPLLAELIRRRPNGRCGLFAFTAVRSGDGTTFVTRLAARELARKHHVECLVVTVDQLSRLPDHSTDRDTFHEVQPGVWAPVESDYRGPRVPDEVVIKRIGDLKNWPGGMVLIDCPPPDGSISAATSLYSRVDGTVVIVAANSTTRQDVSRAGALLKRGNAKVLGTILNRRTYAIPPSVRRYF